MTTQVSGLTGVSQCQPGSVSQDDLAANVVGKGPAFRAYATGSTTITASWNKVSFQAESFDTASSFDSTTNHRFTAPVSGYYQINGHITANSSSYKIGIAVYVDGLPYSYGTIDTTDHTHVSDVIYLVAGSYVEIYGNSGTSQGLVFTTPAHTYFSGHLVRAA